MACIRGRMYIKCVSEGGVSEMGCVKGEVRCIRGVM